MSKKYITAFIVGFIAMIGWNVFLIQRDEKLYKAYYKETAKEQYCTSLKVWHPDCKVE